MQRRDDAVWDAAFHRPVAGSGIYGMSRNAVVLRSHEIGLRRALGASNDDVIATFVRQGTRQLASRDSDVSALLSVLVLFALRQGFSVGAGTLTMLAGGSEHRLGVACWVPTIGCWESLGRAERGAAVRLATEGIAPWFRRSRPAAR